MRKSRLELLEEFRQTKQTKILKQKNSNTVVKKEVKKEEPKVIKKLVKPQVESKVIPAQDSKQNKAVESKQSKAVESKQSTNEKSKPEPIENRVRESSPELQTQESALAFDQSDKDDSPMELKNESFSENKEHELVNHNIVVQLELESKTNQIEQLSSLNKRLKEQLEENESQKNNIIYEMEQTISKLTSEVEELERKPEQHADKWILLTKVEQLQEIINEKDLEIKKLTTAVTYEKDPLIPDLQEKLSEKKQEILDLKSNESYLQSKVNEYQQILNQKDSVIQMQKAQLNDIQTNLNQTQNEFFLLQNTSKKEYDHDYNNLKRNHDELVNENRAIKADLESSMECIEMLEKEIKELEMKLSETQTAHEINSNMYKQNINELEHALNEALSENKNLFTSNGELEKEKQELVVVLEELERIQSTYENNDNRINELEKENLSVMATNSRLQIDLEEYRIALTETMKLENSVFQEKEMQEADCQTDQALLDTNHKDLITKLVLAGDVQTQKYNQSIKQFESKINSLKKEKNIMQNIVDKQKLLETQLIQALEKASEQNKELKSQLNKDE
ncbi:hypothetical protein HDV06_001116 [Boothiomyces sp. JEL0866]|nr:hypothetical protein HDV06_001116 [Boothiomyces sp. JEL0866]